MNSRTFKLVAAFFAIYVVWGSTYLAIRVAVDTVPPLFAAGIRFAIAGIGLFGWSQLRGARAPSRLEWRNLTMLGALMFLASYSGLFWAERTLPSGIASVLVATIPVWTALLEIVVFKRQRLQWTLAVAIAMGLGGVVMIAIDSTSAGNVNLLPCLAILGSEIAWSSGTIVTTMVKLPESKTTSAGAQMMIGGVMLIALSGIVREIPPLPHISTTAWLAIAYLIVAGSLVAFTAFQWLLTQMPTTVVTSYAYVNPVIALLVGYFLGGEIIGVRAMAGSGLVLVSTVALMKSRTTPNAQRSRLKSQEVLGAET
ncbi:MAG TPA: EamA family transporter [Vicinamibacterales bacterium]|jgi:drug/metabolite transporter (DMT)-like permease